MKHEILSRLVVARSDAVVERPAGDGVIHVDVLNNELSELNESALSVWRAIDGQRTAGEIVSVVCEQYGVTEDEGSADTTQADASFVAEGATIRQQILEVIEHLHEKGMVLLSERTLPAAASLGGA